MGRKPKEETAVAKKEETGLQATPDYIEKGPKGTESLSAEHISIPRLKLVQGLTAEHIEEKIPEGHYVNSITKEDYGDRVIFTPIIVTIMRLYFEGEGRDAKLRCRSTDGISPTAEEPLSEICSSCEKSSWKKDKPPECMLIYNYIGIVNGKTILSLSLTRAASKVAKLFNTLLAAEESPIYAKAYEIKSKLENAKKGAYYVPNITPTGWTPKDQYLYCAKKYEVFSKQILKVDFDEEPKAAEKEDGKKEVDTDAF